MIGRRRPPDRGEVKSFASGGPQERSMAVRDRTDCIPTAPPPLLFGARTSVSSVRNGC